jgi:hypothetical protein
MLDCDQKHSSRNRRRRFRIRFRRRFRRRFDRGLVKGIAGEKVELDPAECERIERVLCEELKLRQDLQEELERLKGCGYRPPAIVRAVTSIAGAKAAVLRLGGKPGFRNVGQQQSEKDRRKLASGLKKAIGALDSAHKPLLDALASSMPGVVRSILEGMLKDVLAADLSGVPAHPGKGPGRPESSLSAQPQRALTFLLADIYLDMSGEDPKPFKKRYGFHAFANAMFEAMGMERPSRYIVEAACNFVPKK